MKLIILGTGVFAEEVKDLVDDGDAYEVVGFAENRSRERVSEPLLGLPVRWYEDLAPLKDDVEVVCAIGTTKRSEFVAQATELGMTFARVVHPSARVSRTSSIGAGSMLSAGVIVAAHTTLGEQVIVNRGVLIGHHTRIGSLVTISPGSNIGGRVTIGDGTYVGMGATILNDIRVGEGSIIGAGAVVTRDVPDRVQVLGVPARITKENVDGH